MAIPDQAEVNRRVREWVALFLGPGANPVLDGADTLSLKDAARADQTGSIYATALDVSHFPVGGAHRGARHQDAGAGNVWQDVEAEYSIQFYWHGKFDEDDQGRSRKQIAQAEATDFVLWAQTWESMEQLQRGGLAFLYAVQVDNLTDVAVTESERQDRAGATVRLGYTQRHETRPPGILSIEGMAEHGVRESGEFDDASVYDVTIGRSG